MPISVFKVIENRMTERDMAGVRPMDNLHDPIIYETFNDHAVVSPVGRLQQHYKRSPGTPEKGGPGAMDYR